MICVACRASDLGGLDMISLVQHVTVWILGRIGEFVAGPKTTFSHDDLRQVFLIPGFLNFTHLLVKNIG